MKKLTHFRILPFIAAAILISPYGLFADHHEEGEDTPLHTEMESMDDAFKPLYRAMRKPDPAAKDQYLEWLQTMQVHAINSKVHTPRYFDELGDEERTEMLITYRKDLTLFIETLLQLERAILDDNWETAKDLASELRTHRKSGHKSYDPE